MEREFIDAKTVNAADLNDSLSEQIDYLNYKDFQKKCPKREWISFGHYRCRETKRGCPISRFDRCPDFVVRD